MLVTFRVHATSVITWRSLRLLGGFAFNAAKKNEPQRSPKERKDELQTKLVINNS
ncbi:MAG: hypothetical protein HYV28_04160 [Ignavibacteriales bacterium]|nr:hypothetical protein [Ignavibacteriales bacterium]